MKENGSNGVYFLSDSHVFKAFMVLHLKNDGSSCV